MKKSFIILTSLLLTCIMLIGCAETDTTISTSKELNKNLNILTNTINRMDTVDNQYLVSSDLFSLNTISNKNISNRKSYSNILANSYNVVIEAEEIKNKKDLNETLQKTLKEEIINRLYCDEDGNCKICKDVFTCNEDGTCNSCKQTIICDENGNCNNCGIELTTNTDNNCTNCNQSYISNSCNPNMSLSTKEALMKISSKNNKYLIKPIDTNFNESVDTLNKVGDSILTNIDNKPSVLINNKHQDEEHNTNQLSFNPDTNNTKNTDNNENLTKLNKHITNLEENKSTNINEIKSSSETFALNKKTENNNTEQEKKEIENHTKTITELDNTTTNDKLINSEEKTINDITNKSSQTQTNNYNLDDSNITNNEENIINNNEEINNEEFNNENENKNYGYIFYTEETYVPDKLRYRPRFINNFDFNHANTNLENYVNKLQKLYTMTTDVVEANNSLYNFKLIVLKDIDEAKDLNNCIINGNCTPTNSQIQALNNYIEDIKVTINNLRNCNGDLTNEINKISNANNGIVQSIDVTNSNYLRILNQIDTRISYHENAKATLEQIKYLLEDAKNNNQNIELDKSNNNNITNENVNTNENNNNHDIANNNNDTIINNEKLENNENLKNENLEIESSASEETIKKENSNIDTYDNNIKNIDNSTTETYNNSVITKPQMVSPNTTNNKTIVNGNYPINNNFNNTEFNANNDTTNTIISQNNLNGNYVGNDSYRYDSDGNLYNNTNGYNSYNLSNINNKNNNVNTYKYNTLIDSINRGTINNGINNL